MWAFIACAILAAVTPTYSFVLGVTTACFFNIWCGMRADGVINIRCRNWSWTKFGHALLELVLFLAIIEMVSFVTITMGDHKAAYYACKTAAYCVIYVYIDNGLKNLCKAYPDYKALWIIYLFVHLDFARILKIDDLMKKYDAHLKRQQDEHKSTQELGNNDKKLI